MKSNVKEFVPDTPAMQEEDEDGMISSSSACCKVLAPDSAVGVASNTILFVSDVNITRNMTNRIGQYRPLNDKGSLLVGEEWDSGERISLNPTKDILAQRHSTIMDDGTRSAQ